MRARLLPVCMPVARYASSYRFFTTTPFARSQRHQPNPVMASMATNGPLLPPLTLAIPAHEDDAEVRAKYRPYLLDNEGTASDWVSQLDLDAALQLARQNLEETGSRLKVLVLYGSLRKRYAIMLLGRRGCCESDLGDLQFLFEAGRL